MGNLPVGQHEVFYNGVHALPSFCVLPLYKWSLERRLADR